MALLEVRNVAAGYGHPVLHELSFTIEEGETAVMFGLNGAGKTTTVSVIAGLLQPTSGRIAFDGQNITGRSPPDLVAAGISLVPEGRRVFPKLTVAQNLALGGWVQARRSHEVAAATQEVYERVPRLAERREQLAGTLSGGEQQMLAIGRALISRPRLLLVDEASLGLSPRWVETVFDLVAGIKEAGLTLLMVEQNVGVLARADRVLVLEMGELRYTGPAADLDDQHLRDVYLGASIEGTGK